MDAWRILICRSNPVAPDPRVDKEAHTLAQAGYRVQVLCWDRTGTLPQREDRAGVLIQRLPIRSAYGRGLMNLFPLLRWQIGLFRWLVRHRDEFDVLHACDFDTVLPALFCRWRWGIPVVYDIFDFYADHLRATPAAVKRLIRVVDLWAIGQADAVILADASRKEQIAGSHPRRLAVIYNSPRDADGAPAPAQAGASGDGLHLAYVGLLQVERGLVELLHALQERPAWTLDVAGYGGDVHLLQPLADALPNVRWHGPVSYERALELYRAADVLVATYDPALRNHRYSSPNKVFEAMMLGKPIVVAAHTNMDRLIDENDCGLVVPYGDVAALEAALSRLERDRALRRTLGANGRQAYEQRYRWTRMETRLLDLYREVCPER